eukprot:snap_masked-scaffold_9-processed-gene-9.25-mRNA-1 protein AED:0.93 eAED:1.00 QI:0/0/0/0.66/1/1/3/0/844
MKASFSILSFFVHFILFKASYQKEIDKPFICKCLDFDLSDSALIAKEIVDHCTSEIISVLDPCRQSLNTRINLNDINSLLYSKNIHAILKNLRDSKILCSFEGLDSSDLFRFLGKLSSLRSSNSIFENFLYSYVTSELFTDNSITSVKSQVLSRANLAKFFYNEKNFALALDLISPAYSIATAHPNLQTPELFNLHGLILHYSTKYAEAISIYNEALKLHPNFIRDKIYFNIAVSYKRLNHNKNAEKFYKRSLKEEPNGLEARVNLVALIHEQQRLSNAEKEYEVLMEYLRKTPNGERKTRMEFMSRMNYAQLLMELGDGNKALEVLKGLDGTDTAFLQERNRDLQVIGTKILIKVSSSLVLDLEADVSLFTNMVKERILGRRNNLSMMEKCIHPPFDSFLVDVDLEYRKEIAALCSETYIPFSFTGKLENKQKASGVNLAYMSFDYGNHPTSYMVHGAFNKHNYDKFNPYLINLGTILEPGLRSTMEKKEKELKITFSYSVSSFDDSKLFEFLKEELEIDVLLDLQVHTRGQRINLVRSKPAKVIISFLVFPGTSGVPEIDYLFADSTVIKLDETNFYTEKIIFVPKSFTYQLNYYSEKIEKNTCELNNAFVFCNYNKNDKLGSKTLKLFVEILLKVPNSVLHLVEPSRKRAAAIVKKNILRFFEFNGLSLPEERVIFVERLPKKEHLKRVTSCHLFLDSLIYNAHSTAADTIFSGVPILTVRNGKSFPSRVVSSLLLAFDAVLYEILATFDERDYVNMAITLATNEALYDFVRKRFESLENTNLFNTEFLVNFLEQAIFPRSISAVILVPNSNSQLSVQYSSQYDWSIHPIMFDAEYLKNIT